LFASIKKIYLFIKCLIMMKSRLRRQRYQMAGGCRRVPPTATGLIPQAWFWH